jgi:hypothetical protein
LRQATEVPAAPRHTENTPVRDVVEALIPIWRMTDEATAIIWPPKSRSDSTGDGEEPAAPAVEAKRFSRAVIKFGQSRPIP